MRFLNRGLGLLLAVALVATGVLVVIEVIAWSVNAHSLIVPWPTWEHWARHTKWNQTVIKVWAIVLLAVGVILVLAQLKPRREKRVVMNSSDAHTDIAITRRGLRGAVRAAVLDVDGVARVEAKVRRRYVRVTAFAHSQDSESASKLQPDVQTAAEDELGSLRLQHAVLVRASVKAAKT